ncbi:MAG: CDP-glycerol glycerophosphotransferase family protein [Candidatus Omnitrophica bacterium]|nr:CDP-glycerol glycerophosphotransferase family protein [Candidatus Omnitrophota bacterium]
MKTILISIPVGYYARNLLRTGMPGLLLAPDPDLQLILTTPAYQDPDFIGEFSNHGRIFTSPLYDVRPTHNGWERVLWKGCIASMKNRSVFLPLMRLNHLCYRYLSPRRYTSLFKTWKPVLLITASPGFHSQKDIPLIREAQDHGVKTLCAVFSWDNLTTNGIFPTRPDYLAVWNELMKEEAITIHHYDPEKIFIVGPTAFDIYQDPSVYLPRETFCKKLGLDPKKKIVTLTTAPPAVFDHRYLVQMLLRFARKGLFRHPVQLLCRVHPLDQKDLYKEFEGNPLIHFDYPGRYSGLIKWDPDRGEMIHLANTLKQSDVIVNIASTITIESAIVDTPVINVGFSTVQERHFQKKIFRDHYEQHYHHVLESGGAWNVRSEEELLEALNTYLEDPSRDREARRKMAEKLCYRLDGKSSERLAGLIRRLSS